MKKSQNNLFSISELVNEFRVGKDAIHLYGSHKLLRPNPEKTEGAFYRPLDKLRLAFIVRAKQADYTIGNIKMLIGELDLKKDSDAQLAESLIFSKKKIIQLKESLKDLDALEQINITCDLELLEAYTKELTHLRYESENLAPIRQTAQAADPKAFDIKPEKSQIKDQFKDLVKKLEGKKKTEEKIIRRPLLMGSLFLLVIIGYAFLYFDYDRISSRRDQKTAPAEVEETETRQAGLSQQPDSKEDVMPLDLSIAKQTPDLRLENSAENRRDTYGVEQPDEKNAVAELSKDIEESQDSKTEMKIPEKENTEEGFYQQLVADLQKKYDTQEKNQATTSAGMHKESSDTPKETDAGKRKNSEAATTMGVSALTEKNTVDGIKKDLVKPIQSEKIEKKTPKEPAKEKPILKTETSIKDVTIAPSMAPRDTQKQSPVSPSIDKPSVNAADKAPPQPIAKAAPPAPAPQAAPAKDETKSVKMPATAKRNDVLDTASLAPKPEPKPAPEKTVDPKAVQWVQKSYESVLKGDAGEAIVAATVALTLEPDLVNAYINRSWAYSKKGQYDKAIQDCNKALDIDPNNALAYNNRGLALQGKGDIDGAKNDYDKACKLGFDVACKNFQELAGR